MGRMTVPNRVERIMLEKNEVKMSLLAVIGWSTSRVS
jgi:hypothetical protein